MNEFERNIAFTNLYTKTELVELLSALRSAAIVVEVEPLFTQSPDPKDNFLFDLAIQTNSEVIVSEEKALLAFKNSPVPVHSIKWFKETYPVPL